MRERGKGKWQLEVDLGKTINGKGRNRKYRTITAKNKTEANRKLTHFIAELTKDGYIENTKIGFIEFVVKHWLPKCAQKRMAHTTLISFYNRLEIRILPAFQHFNLDEIKPIHIIDFLDDLGKDGKRMDGKKGKLSQSSIYEHYRTLKSIFDFALEIKFLKESPLEGVKKPSVQHKEVKAYEQDQLLKLLSALERESEFLHWQVFVKLAVTTGMRRSELFGLEFKHFELDGEVPIVKVKQALTYSKQEGFQIHEIKKGNNTAKKRDIVLSKSLVEPIKKLQLQRKEEKLAFHDQWKDGKYDLLITHEDGTPYHPGSINLWWTNFIQRHELDYINIHALRHTTASLLINADVHPKVISERLGHSDIKTTMNVYGHVFKKADEIATEKIDDLLFNNKELL